MLRIRHVNAPAAENSAALLTDVLVVGGGPAGAWAPYKREAARVGGQLLSRLRDKVAV